jgi:cell division protein FtsB
MLNRIRAWLRASLQYLWLIALAAYLAVLAGQAITRNYLAQQETKRLQKELTAAIQERDRLQAELVYYQTDSFRELELRRNLLLRLPGETVYALPESGIGNQPAPTLAVAPSPSLRVSREPIWRQWIDYVLGRTRRDS